MSKKQLDTAAITSELRGQSAFFPARPDVAPVSHEPIPATSPASASAPAVESVPELASEQQIFPPTPRSIASPTVLPAAPAAGRTDGPSSVSTPVPSPGPSVERPPVRPKSPMPPLRTITRYAFEFYQDQIETLRALSLEQKYLGQKGSMSEMVRDALDAYITQVKRAEE